MASSMKICSSCARHLMAPEPQCPFCGAQLPMAPSPLVRCGQVIMMGLTIALGSVGCGPSVVLEDEPTGDGVEESSGAPVMMTTAPATGDGPAMSTGSEPGTDVSTGSDSASEEDTFDDSNDSGCSFYAGCSPDGGTVNFECDLYAQDCPEGEKCMPWANDGGGSWNATRCSPIANDPGQVGEPCTVEGSGSSGIDDCDQGLMCWSVDSKTNEGICEDLCIGDPSEPGCADEADVCVVANDGAIVLCLPGCDPLLQDCGEGEGCFPSPTDEFFCGDAPYPESMPGDSCGFINGCAPGQACLFSGCGGDACCSTYCALDDPDADLNCAALDPAQECVPWYEEGMAPVGGENIGICAVPS